MRSVIDLLKLLSALCLLGGAPALWAGNTEVINLTDGEVELCYEIEGQERVLKLAAGQSTGRFSYEKALKLRVEQLQTSLLENAETLLVVRPAADGGAPFFEAHHVAKAGEKKYCVRVLNLSDQSQEVRVAGEAREVVPSAGLDLGEFELRPEIEMKGFDSRSLQLEGRQNFGVNLILIPAPEGVKVLTSLVYGGDVEEAEVEGVEEAEADEMADLERVVEEQGEIERMEAQQARQNLGGTEAAAEAMKEAETLEDLEELEGLGESNPESP